MARDGRRTARGGTGRREAVRETGRGTGRGTGTWLARAWRACVVAAVAASVAGCVGMQNNGSPGTFGATPQGSTQDSEFIRALPAGPGSNWGPSQIVTGFLNASASYPVYSAVAKQYLVGAAVNKWNPEWTVKVVDQVSPPGPADMSPGGRQATVHVTGKVRASFNGTGQYVGAQQNRGGAQTADWQFELVKVNGQWRITNPPNFRLLTEPDFSQVYKPQDLYFFDWTGQVLVPDAVFVPAGTSPNSLVSNLVGALLKPPQTPWLQPAANTTPPVSTAFPSKTTIINVAVDGTTATVNLGGAAASTNDTVRGQISAQLVWTLTGQQQAPQAIQAVQLEINGRPWMPTKDAPCEGAGGQGQSPALKLAMYSCYNPYPTAASASFYYVGHGQAWSRCAPESQATEGSIGPIVPVFGRTSAAQLNQSCGRRPVLSQTPALPPPQPRSVPALSMVAVSPDSKYMAGVSANGDAIDIWASGSAKLSNSITTSGVSAISWDRNDYLWITESDTTWMVAPASNGSSTREIPNAFGGKITGLSVAPDGVRVAAIALTGSGRELELAAIDRSATPSGQLRNPLARPSIGPAVQLGSNITDPVALTWYDADDLLVLDGTGAGTRLWEVPVDGQPATKLPGVLPGAISITANSPQNALVVGLSGGQDGQLEVSAGLEGPWQPLGNGGQNPAFPTPLIPVAAQS
jgi:hypothetical protein